MSVVDIHVHTDASGDSQAEILSRLDGLQATVALLVDAVSAVLPFLQAQEHTMSDVTQAVDGLTTAVNAMTSRINEDVAHLNDIISQMAATEVSNTAEIARLIQEAADSVASIQAATAVVAQVDPDTGFPVIVPVEDPPVDPPVDPAPVDPPVDEFPADPGEPVPTPEAPEGQEQFPQA